MKKIYLSLLLFLLIFCVLGPPFTKWGFRCDDWGNIFHSVTHTWKDICVFFIDGKSLDDFYSPSNYTTIKPAFFCGLYRPMSLVYLVPQYWLFAAHPYGYFLITIALHALTSVILFNIFSLFTCLSSAFFGAAFFGFHPSLHTWLGWISAQTYQIQLLIFLLILLLLKLYLDKKNIWAYLLACGLFLSNIFLHEQTFFLPFWLMLGIPLYEKYSIRVGVGENSPLKNFFLSLPFLGITIAYMLTRLHYFPLTSNTATLTFQPSWISFKTRIAERIFDFATFITDIFGLTALPQNHPYLKTSILVILFLILVWLFIKTRHKLITIFLACSISLFGWPAILMHNQPRYYYLAIPLFIAIVLILIPTQKFSKKIQYLSMLAITLFITCNALFLLQDLKIRENLYHPVTQAFKAIANNTKTHNRSICFIGLPAETHLFGACAQAIWLIRGKNDHPVFSIAQLPLEQQYKKFNPIYIIWNNQNKNFTIHDT